MATIWRGSLPSVYHQWIGPTNIAFTSPLLTHLTFWLESSSSSSSSSCGLSDLCHERPHNEEWSLKVSRDIKKTISSFPTCRDISMLCRCNYKMVFFCNHVKYKNMHSPTSGKVNQLRSIEILWNLDGVYSNHISVEGNHFTLYFLVVICGGQLEGSTFVTGRSKRTKGRTLGRLDWAFPNLKRPEKFVEKKKHYFWFTSIGQSEVGT